MPHTEPTFTPGPYTIEQRDEFRFAVLGRNVDAGKTGVCYSGDQITICTTDGLDEAHRIAHCLAAMEAFERVGAEPCIHHREKLALCREGGMSTKPPRGAVMQFEIDLERWKATNNTTFQLSNGISETPMQRMYALAKSAACDVIYRGGTFVLVVTDTKITMVQRPDAEEIGEAA